MGVIADAATGPTVCHRAMTRPAQLVLVKAVHTVVFVVELAAILWLVVTGVVGRRDRSTALATMLVVGEALVVVANEGVCPLTPIAERLGARHGGVSDMFLPDAVARTIPLWSTALVALAAALHVRGLARVREAH
jgi:hypothetical protein